MYSDGWSTDMYEMQVCYYTCFILFIWSIPPSPSPLPVPSQEEFIRGALAQLEAERDEVKRQLEEEHRLHMAARQQAALALSLEHQHNSHKPVQDHHHEHDHTQDQHSHCEHRHEHSGEKTYMFIDEKPD